VAPTALAWDAARIKAETAALNKRIQETLKNDLPEDLRSSTLVYLRTKLSELPKQPPAVEIARPVNLRRDLAEAQHALADQEQFKRELVISVNALEAEQHALIERAQTELQAIRFRGDAQLESADCAIRRAAEVLAKVNLRLDAEAPPSTPPPLHVGEQRTMLLLQGILETCDLGPEVARFIHNKMHVAFVHASVTTPIPTDSGEDLRQFGGSTQPGSLEDDGTATAEDGAKPPKIPKSAPGSVGASLTASSAAGSLEPANREWENA
jgi:hypothetical protein